MQAPDCKPLEYIPLKTFDDAAFTLNVSLCHTHLIVFVQLIVLKYEVRVFSIELIHFYSLNVPFF